MKLELSAFLKDLILQTRHYPPIVTNTSLKAKEIQAMMAAPCQISALWFKNETKVDIQAFLITHNPKYKDLEISVIGPLFIESNESYNTIEQRLTTIDLFRFVGADTDISKLKSEWVKILRNLVSNLSLQLAIPSEIKFKFYLGKLIGDLHYFSCIRKLQARKVSSPLAKFEKYIQLMEYHENFYHTSKETDVKYTIGWSLGFPIWINNFPQITFSDRIQGESIKKFISCEIETSYRNRVLQIDTDGYCRLSLYEEIPLKNKEMGKEILKDINDLLMIFLINEFFMPQISHEDLSLWKTGKKTVGDSIKRPKILNFDDLMRVSYPKIVKTFRQKYCDEVDFSKLVEVPKKTIESIIKKADTINRYPKLYSILHTLQKAYTFLETKETNMAYILSWSIIEQFICQVWHKEKEKREISSETSNIIKKVKDKNSVGDKLHDLEVWGLITKKGFKKLKKIAQSRNKFLHELKPINSHLLKEIFNFACDVAQNLFNKRIELEFDIENE